MFRLKLALQRGNKLFRSLPLFDALKVLFWTALRQRKRVSVRVGDTRLSLRTLTSDLSVAISSLVAGEYDNIHVRNASAIIDGGANIGTSAIAFAKRHPRAMIIAIEPEAENFALLTDNVRGWDRIRPYNAALASSSGDRTLFDRGTGAWGFTITHSPQGDRCTGQIIRCITVGEIIEQFGFTKVDIIKLDIEGGEKEVLEHSEAWIDRVDVLVAELHDRIMPGCERAFAAATQGFHKRSRHGEKLVAYRYTDKPADLSASTRERQH